METKVIDNFISNKNLLEHFYYNFISNGKIELSFKNKGYENENPHSFTSSKNENNFDEIYLIHLLYHKIKNQFKEAIIKRWHLNVYPPGFDGTIHKDSENEKIPTFLYCGTPNWHRNWGGEFIIYDNKFEAKEVISFQEDRMIIFDGSLPHRAIAPSKNCPILRTTIAFHSYEK
jgi:Rps23 Pro-64 3,4-dihydroxylase Tpa1-like proline 4-hydroxylase